MHFGIIVPYHMSTTRLSDKLSDHAHIGKYTCHKCNKTTYTAFKTYHTHVLPSAWKITGFATKTDRIKHTSSL